MAIRGTILGLRRDQRAQPAQGAPRLYLQGNELRTTDLKSSLRISRKELEARALCGDVFLAGPIGRDELFRGISGQKPLFLGSHERRDLIEISSRFALPKSYALRWAFNEQIRGMTWEIARLTNGQRISIAGKRGDAELQAPTFDAGGKELYAWTPIKKGDSLVVHILGVDFSVEFNLSAIEKSFPQRTNERDGKLYRLIEDPVVLTDGMNIPGQKNNASRREIIAIRFNDPHWISFVDRLLREFPNADPNSVDDARKVYDFVREQFDDDKTWTDDESGWQGEAWERVHRLYPDTKVSLGTFIFCRSGCCRHKATVLQLAYQLLGFKSTFARGAVLMGGRHVWTVVTINGDEYVSDPNMNNFGKKKKETFLNSTIYTVIGKDGIIYEEGENVVEVPIKKVSPDSSERQGAPTVSVAVGSKSSLLRILGLTHT